MYRVSKSVSFCYGHRLLNYQGKCQHLHGHNARAVITLAQDTLDDRGMVEDFSELKRLLWEWLESEIDHTLLLHKDDPILPLLQDSGERVRVTEENPTAEVIARMIYEYVAAKDFPVTDVTLWETETSYASYSKTPLR
ncbi:MAG: 6-carboxytetrahydropterin synthase [Gammaproteobacteria bacterium]|jgi:6-pyruvoyltetrahydropterin/6-carboxytetrahydropterin synthase|nr:6-carboxytetrahydropterin synthase [Gammaproteobacteria bacterium]